MLVGIDFDNTIAGYDRIFPAAAEREGLLPAGAANSKSEVRAALQARDDGEREWMHLQGRVYGAHMQDADLIEGVADFLLLCKERRLSVCIVSHKTEYGHFDDKKINLRLAAREWMASKGFFDIEGFGLTPDRVHFESTRGGKVARIGEIGCTHFVDDLVEVFHEPGFPSAIKGYLLANSGGELPDGPFTACRHWREITDDILGSC